MAGFQSGHHQIVRFHIAFFFIDDDLTLLIEHKGYTARCANVAVALCERASDVGSGTVLVIGQGIDDDCDSAGAIAFVSNIFVINVADVAGSLLNSSFNGVVRHVVGFCLCNDLCQLEVVRRVRTTLFYGNCNFSSENALRT